MAALNTVINPNATEQVPAFPPQFVSAVTPTPAALYHQIPPDVQFNLYRVIKEGIRHEQNAYGYFNSALTSIFSPTQRFQVGDLSMFRLPIKLINEL